MVGEGGRVFHSEHGVKGLRLVGHGGGMGGGCCWGGPDPLGTLGPGSRGSSLVQWEDGHANLFQDPHPSGGSEKQKTFFPLKYRCPLIRNIF